MKRFFGSSKEKAPPPPTLSEATERVDGRVGKLEEKVKSIDSELRTIREQISRTRSPAAQNSLKQKAMRLLKQKKMFETQRDTLMNQAFNMEQANFTMQSMEDTAITITAMKTANKTMKTQFKELKIDDVDDLWDDMADMMEENKMIQDAMGRAFDTPSDLDESELEAELDALGDEFLMGEDIEEVPSYMTSISNSSSLPSTPSSQLPSHQQSENPSVGQILQTF